MLVFQKEMRSGRAKMTMLFSRSSLAHLSVISGLRTSMFAPAHSRGALIP